MGLPNNEGKYHKAIRQFQAFIVTEELIKQHGNVCKAARELGMHRNTLNRTISTLRINVWEIKHGTNGTGVEKNSTNTVNAQAAKKSGKVSEVSS
jgi:hypothetical protein